MRRAFARRRVQTPECLQNKKPVLQRLTESIPWESFRLLLEKGYALTSADLAVVSLGIDAEGLVW
jgi:hypothetical protein